MNNIVRAQILDFLENPVEFSTHGTGLSRDRWLAGIDALNLTRPLLEAQRLAWEGIADHRLALLLGPPGTGKTFALSAMAVGFLLQSAKVGSPCRIFVTAFTRNAIMNLLSAIASKCPNTSQQPIPISFIGNADTKPESDRVGFIDRKTGSAELEAMTGQQQFVVGATIWSLRRLLLDKKGAFKETVFDLVLLDEASQLPVSNGLMALSAICPQTRVVVAGDDRQLPPIRTALGEDSDPKRLSSSLYDFLKASGVAEFPLEETFRLNQALASFPERKFYPGKYRSFGDVSEARLSLRQGWMDGLPPWTKTVLDPENPICVLLHDGLPAGTHNNFEVKVVSELVRSLYQAVPEDGEGPSNKRFWSERLAVISPHRAQNAAIRKSLGGHPCAEDAVVETVERIQGRERDAIIISYTVSDPEFAQSEGAFLFSPQRLNVMITRARTKLIVVVSRRLLEVVPSEEDVLEAAQHLREFVYDTAEVGRVNLHDGEGSQVQVSLRVKTFGSVPMPLDYSEPESTEEEVCRPEYTRELEEMFKAIQKISLASKYASAADFEIKKALFLRTTPTVRDLYPLAALGRIQLERRDSDNGGFWAATPVDPPRVPYASTEDCVRERLEEVIRAVRKGRFAPFYKRVRSRFLWMDQQGVDILRPILEKLAGEGVVVLGADTVDLVDVSAPQDMVPVDSPEEALQDEDFEVMNALEDLEIRRINFGITESWPRVKELSESLDLPRSSVLASVIRLRAHGYLMHEEEGRIRSRMAELARELRYTKQRFEPGDRDKRPYLVRGLKIETIQRQKPLRSTPLSEALREISSAVSDPDVEVVLGAIQGMLAKKWAVSDPLMAGFQCRAMASILKAWLGHGDVRSFVITADTGSGKTEAACLPMIAGAAVDVRKGTRGSRAILVYPRIRLAANQAQRIVGYLAELNRQPGIVPLSIGLQNGSVPGNFRSLVEREKEEWGATSGGLSFPFFGCPHEGCGKDLILQVRGGHEGFHDRLSCSVCKWSYDSWVGDKLGLRENPPHFFLPVTESLHQWQQNSYYGTLFGDSPNWSPPRAILADEIHLYSHIHGAQVGLTLRRLLARIQVNHPSKLTPLAVGMSATLGSPEAVWGQLIGRTPIESLSVEPAERKENVRGREYFYFIQPEVESRGKDIAGASATIQCLMCLAHGIRRRTGAEGGFRAIVFLDSIDKVKRLHGDYQDAEESKSLAQLRTYLYDDDPGTGSVRRECCGEPLCCDRFQQGECWFFAAKDDAQWTARGRYRRSRHLNVCPTPIYSATKGRAETLMRQSDIVFSTSTLEVGYDDPDITMVYQHYSPQNLASFVQRKGRGGRGADDRPVTGVTLSAYSPRDSWYFRRPTQMLDAAHFEVPLNMANFFVIRGQVACSILDAIARTRSQNLGPALGSKMELKPIALQLAAEMVSISFGPDILEHLGCENLTDFWDEVVQGAKSPLDPASQPKDWAEQLDCVPVRLFDSINLPILQVQFKDENGQVQSRTEDIAQAFYLIAAGNITRRYGHQLVHWIPPTDGPAVFLPKECYKFSHGFSLFEDDATGQQLVRELPSVVREQLGPSLYPKICRPELVRFQEAGKIHGTGWTAQWRYDPKTKGVESAGLPNSNTSPRIDVGPKSRGTLRGFVVVKADSSLSKQRPLAHLDSFVDRAEVFLGGRTGVSTGLRVARIYWGADIDLQLEDLKIREATLTQTFCYPDTDKTLLHGYQVETEGLRYHLRSDVLDSFVSVELERLSTQEPQHRTMRGRFLAYLAETRLTSLGFNGYEANRLSELLVSAASQPEGRDTLKRIQRRWDPKSLLDLLKTSFTRSLRWHPLLSERRVEKLGSIVENPRFRDLFLQIMNDVGNEELFRHYLRSLVIHGLCHRLRDLFVLRGYGDERRVICHAKLPIQFGTDAEDVITIAENGNHGDGTTRAFLGNFDQSMREWMDSGLVECANAAEDRLLEAIFHQEGRHDAWRTLDPRDADQMSTLVKELKLDSDPVGLNRIIQVFYGSESIGAENFDFYDLYREIRSVSQGLESEFKREPMTWELVSAVVERAAVPAESTLTPRLSALLRAYQSVEDASDEGSMSPEARLADQVYRLSGKLCPDGCEACLYGDSHLMSNTAARNLLSRGTLERFADFVTTSR